MTIVEYYDPRQNLPSLQEPPWLSALRGLLDALPDTVKRRLAEAAVPIELAPPHASQAEQYEHYKRIIEVRGCTLDPNSPTVLAVPGMSSDGAAHTTTSSTHYDDTIVVLTRDAKGDPHVTTLPGSTHPGQTRASIGGRVGVPDVNGDGQADVGMIEPGEYRLTPHGEHNGAAAWDVKTESNSGNLPGVRDTDHDGNFTSAECAASESRGDTLNEVMIHQGGPNAPQSAGCLNLSSNSTVYPHFIQAVGGATESMKLIVIDANRS
jgi:hypothetical protein